jgi:molybdopterin-guanine dinucleotide biosynthesis protein A
VSAAPYDAVVLAGGAATRLRGIDKPAAEVGRRRLLDRVLAAVGDAERVVVVGPRRGWEPPTVTVVREDPPGGGPVAAIAAGLAATRSTVVAVLAGDLPFLTSSTIATLRAALAEPGEPPADGAVLVDDGGRDQLLAGVWRAASLRTRCAALPVSGAAVRNLATGLVVRRVSAAGEATDGPPPWWDCDTDADLRRAREWA